MPWSQRSLKNHGNTYLKISTNYVLLQLYSYGGINLESGSIIFNVTGTIPKGMSGSNLNQNNRILTYNEKECKISPILLVDEEDVSANHSAYIGKFREEELFYLMSRGITESMSTMLLTKGFLNSKLNVKEEVKEQLEQYLETVWR